MSVKIMAAVWAWGTKADWSPSERLVMLALGDTANDEGKCWPGIAVIAEKAGVARETGVRLLASLVERGWIEAVKRRTAEGRQATTIYGMSAKTLRIQSDKLSPCGISEKPQSDILEIQSDNSDGIQSDISAPLFKNSNQHLQQPPPPSGGGDESQQPEKAATAAPENPYERLKRLGVSPKVVGAILRSEKIPPADVTAKCEAYEQALEDGANVGPGLLADALLNGTDILPARAKKPTPPPRPPVKWFDYECIGCGKLQSRSAKPDGSPTCETCCDGLMLMPADDTERRMWAREIAHMMRLKEERARMTAAQGTRGT